MTKTQQFFSRLYGKLPPGYFFPIWKLPSRRSVFVPCAEVIDASLEADKADHAGQEVYFGVNPFSKDLGAYKKGTEAEVSALVCYWIDIDVLGPVKHAASNLPPDLASALALVAEAGLPDPTMTVASGGGLHLYWVLQKPELIKTQHDTTRCQRSVQSWQGKIIAAGSKHGWHVDNTSNLDRILRVPGTHNRKRQRDSRRAIG